MRVSRWLSPAAAVLVVTAFAPRLGLSTSLNLEDAMVTSNREGGSGFTLLVGLGHVANYLLFTFPSSGLPMSEPTAFGETGPHGSGVTFASAIDGWSGELREVSDDSCVACNLQKPVGCHAGSGGRANAASLTRLEPSSLSLLGFGLLAFACMVRKRRTSEPGERESVVGASPSHL